MKAVTWHGTNDVRVERVPDPAILNPRDIIVRVTTTAICGSDLHLMNGFIPTMQAGDILGHEFMGEVVEVGKGVGNLSVGDRVVVPFPIACGSCSACHAQLFAACENSNPNAGLAEKVFGHPTAGVFGYSHLTGGFAGGQAQYARVPFADVGPLKVDEDLTDEQAAEVGARLVGLAELLHRSDVITVHTPLTPRTRGLLGRAQLEATKPGAVVLNVARGGIVAQPATRRAPARASGARLIAGSPGGRR